MKIIQCMRFSFECAGVRRAAVRIYARGTWPNTQGYVRRAKKSPGWAGGFLLYRVDGILLCFLSRAAVLRWGSSGQPSSPGKRRR